MDLKKEIAKVEKRVKATGRVTMTDVCKLAGISKAAWSRWKNGSREPRLSTWKKAMAAVDKLAPVKK